MTTSEQHSLTTLRSLIKDIRFAMLTTLGKDGMLASRPMTTQAVDDTATEAVWFFVAKSGGIVESITEHQNVCVSYADPDSDTYVSVSGRAVLEENLQHKQALWSPMTQAWFPNGPTDPDVGLLRVDIVRAHYWDVKKSRLMQLFDMAKASITGTTPKELGESVEVSLQR